MRIFVIGTARCGATTFLRACRHLTNFTTGRSPGIPLGEGKAFLYPDHHIEVDPRLAWFLGSLADRYPDAVFVHLRRRRNEVVDSLVRHWSRLWQDPCLTAFRQVALPKGTGWSFEQRRHLGELVVDSTLANVDTFLRTRTSLTLWLHEIQESFPVFLDFIGAEGNLAAALDEWLFLDEGI